MDLRVGPPHYSNTKIIQYLAVVLYWIGKPFFLLLSGFFLAAVSLLWLIGNTTLKLFNQIGKFLALPLPVKRPTIKLPAIPRISWPHPAFPKLTFPGRFKIALF